MPPVEVLAQANSVVKQGLVLLAKPSLTPTMPKSCPLGRDDLHCGQDTSLPVKLTELVLLGLTGLCQDLAARAVVGLTITTSELKSVNEALINVSFFT